MKMDETICHCGRPHPCFNGNCLNCGAYVTHNSYEWCVCGEHKIVDEQSGLCEGCYTRGGKRGKKKKA